MSSVFTKIVNKEIPCYKVAETSQFLAFLDVNPNAKGHTLCIPKNEIDKIFDLDTSAYIELMRFSRTVAIALEKAVDCKRVGMSVIGLEVPHAHVHLIPLNTMEDAQFIKKETLSSEDFEATASAIASYL